MPNATEAALSGLRKRDLIAFLESDSRVQDWLSGGDPDEPGGGALLSSKEAAALLPRADGTLGVERARIWRWEKAGRIRRVATTNATPLFMRAHVEKLRDELLAEQAKREPGPVGPGEEFPPVG